MPRITIKDHIRESHLFNSRAVVALAVIGIFMLAVISRLLYLQVYSHEHFTTLSQNNRVNIVPIAPTRGLIYDRNGVLLAQNLPSFSLEITPERVKDMDVTLKELIELVDINEQDISRFQKELQQNRRFQRIPLRFRLTEDEVARFSVNQHRFPGVEIGAQLVRDYPRGNLAVHTIGYVGRINQNELETLDMSVYRGTNYIGKVGVEKTYEDLLHGSAGLQKVESNANGRVLRVLERTAPVPGTNVRLTIDSRLQATAESALKNNRGAIVAITPTTGELLVLASAPGYDPNLFVNGVDRNEYQLLQESGAQPLFNRVLRGQYPPGSTLKPFIGLAGLEEQTITKDSRVFCQGWYHLEGDDRKYRDWKREGHEHTNLDKAIVQSCDVYFYDLALKLGIDRIHTFVRKFGFGQTTGVDIAGEVGGLMPSREWKRRARDLPWFPGETLITGIGQGFTLTTPLQLASATATLSTRGLRVQPHVLYATQAPNSPTIVLRESQQNDVILLTQPDHWETIITAMKRVIHSLHGTARAIGTDSPYKIAGKTGTAQVFGIKQDEEYEQETVQERLRDHALFIGFAPADNPRIAIAVIVENGGSGGGVAAPIARTIIDQYLQEEHHAEPS